MKNKTTVDLEELKEAGIISAEQANQIVQFYQKEGTKSQNRLFVVFGVLGAVLVGMGIILILAHNWDSLARSVKTMFAFLPMLVGQGLCAYALLKKQDSQTWLESSAAFLFFAVGASISLVSQIYNIPGQLDSFVFTWMLLCLPLVYLMRASMVATFYILGITYFACGAGYWFGPSMSPYWYWLLLLLILPHYYFLYKNRPSSNFLNFHHWLIPLSITIALGTIADGNGVFMFIGYMSLFGLFYQLGYFPYWKHKKRRSNAYAVLGSVGSIGLLLALSFDGLWEEITDSAFDMVSPEFTTALLLTAAGIGLLFWKVKRLKFKKVMPFEILFLLFIPLFIAGLNLPILGTVLTNLLILGLGIATIRQGAMANHLGVLNYGLIIITVLIICRFFDTNISFVIRGLLFLLIGLGFFFTNYRMLKKRESSL